jgi:hypothetical protein
MGRDGFAAWPSRGHAVGVSNRRDTLDVLIMRNYQGFGKVAEATAKANAQKNPGSQIFKWAVGLIIACLFMASAVCRAHEGHEHTTPPVITDTTPAPAPFIESGQGRLYNEIEQMGIYGSAVPTDPTGGGDDSTDFVPLDNPFLGTSGECEVPTVPLPAAIWAGLAGGAIVLGRGRGRRRARW